MTQQPAASPPHVAFVGVSGSGKTTVLEAVVRALHARGLRVAFVKHTHHRLDFDTPGKDSWRLREAGAGRVALVTPERYLLQADRAGMPDPDALFGGCDLVLHEGNRDSEHAKVIVAESPEDARARGTRGEIIAVLSDAPGAESGGVPVLTRDDIDSVVRLILTHCGLALPSS